MGPVEEMVVSNNGGLELIVMGQSFVATQDVSEGIGIGDYVVAAGVAAGALDVLIPLGETYVPGASEVRVIGVVSDVQEPLAQLSIGGAVYDYSGRLVTDPAYTPSEGDLIDIAGVQPDFRGIIILE
jgi:hypothetical protein